VDTDPAGGGGWYGRAEEDPDVPPVARAGSFQSDRDSRPAGGIEIGQRVERPTDTVEVAYQHAARITRQERIQAGVDPAGQVPLGHLVGEGQVFPVRAAGVHPYTGDGRAPAALRRESVLPPLREGGGPSR